MSESEQTPPDQDFFSEYYRERPPPDRPRRRREPQGFAAFQERAKAWVPRSGAFGQLRVRIGALVAVAVALGFIIWAAVGGGGGGSNNPSPSPPAAPNAAAGTGPVALSFGGLKTLAATLQQPIYWLGTKPGTMYELRQLTNGNVYLRYLPEGVQAGDPRALLTVGTYPMQNAFSVTKGLANKSGSVSLDPGGGGIGFYTTSNPTDAYVAFPGADYQIEVYSPAHGVARRAVENGVVKAVPTGGAQPGVKAISPAGLRALAKSLGQPIYWAGRRPSTTLELTQTTSGRIYVRYLPRGVSVGATGAYLTIGTYPVTNAFAATSSLGDQPENRSLKLPGGGIAAFGKSAKVNNVYLAYPNSDYQVEVFSPTPGTARAVVAQGRIEATR